MADPVNTIVDEIPIPASAYWIHVVDDWLYCSGNQLTVVDLRTKASGVLAGGVATGCLALVDFHRAFNLPPDVAGSGVPDRRLYTPAAQGKIGEIIPALLNQFSSFDVRLDPSIESSVISSMAGTNRGKYLYFNDWTRHAIGIVDLDRPDPRVVGTIRFDSVAFDMVVSPDDRFIYASHEIDDTVSVIDTSSFPPSITTVPVVNSPWGLALSADGKRLFVAQSGIEDHPPTSLGTGSLTVLDTTTMQGVWLYTGKTSVDVLLNAAETRAYVSNFDDNTVSVVDVTGSPVLIDTIDGFTAPGNMCFSADGKHMYVTQYRDPSAGPPLGIAVVAV
jgi:YVTN family beta-propeller protein